MGSENPRPPRNGAGNAWGKESLGRSSRGEICVLRAQQTNVPRKGWRVSVLGFPGHVVSVAINQICPWQLRSKPETTRQQMGEAAFQ